jgi:rod shape-determining protein MreD
VRQALATILLTASPFLVVALRRAIPALTGLEDHAPDPVILGLAFVALRVDPVSACLWAACCGFLLDAPSGTPFGLGAARLALVTAALGTLRTQLDTETLAVRALVVIGAGIAEKTLGAIVLEASSGEVPILALLGRGALVAFATVTLVPVLWPALEMLRATAGGRRARAR